MVILSDTPITNLAVLDIAGGYRRADVTNILPLRHALSRESKLKNKKFSKWIFLTLFFPLAEPLLKERKCL